MNASAPVPSVCLWKFINSFQSWVTFQAHAFDYKVKIHLSCATDSMYIIFEWQCKSGDFLKDYNLSHWMYQFYLYSKLVSKANWINIRAIEYCRQIVPLSLSRGSIASLKEKHFLFQGILCSVYLKSYSSLEWSRDAGYVWVFQRMRSII